MLKIDGSRKYRVLGSRARKVCRELACARRIFTEPLPGSARPYARRSARLGEALHWVTLNLGGASGARVADRLGLLVNGSSLLRQLRRRTRTTAMQSPRVLGIDDWAWRKGHRYGTILCDLEQRESSTCYRIERLGPLRAGWNSIPEQRSSAGTGPVLMLKLHRSAPRAVQGADRWHLLRNPTVRRVGAAARRISGRVAPISTTKQIKQHLLR
jgi:hypothetical protein